MKLELQVQSRLAELEQERWRRDFIRRRQLRRRAMRSEQRKEK